MSDLAYIGGAIAVAFIGIVILIAVFGRKSTKTVIGLERQEAVLAKGLDAKDMDEGFAHQLTPAPSIEQAARDKGAV